MMLNLLKTTYCVNIDLLTEILYNGILKLECCVEWLLFDIIYNICFSVIDAVKLSAVFFVYWSNIRLVLYDIT